MGLGRASRAHCPSARASARSAELTQPRSLHRDQLAAQLANPTGHSRFVPSNGVVMSLGLEAVDSLLEGHPKRVGDRLAQVLALGQLVDVPERGARESDMR